jgi:hypothetical protein
MAFFPGDTAAVKLGKMKLNGVGVFADADISFEVFHPDDEETPIADGIGTQEGTTNNWLLVFDIPDDIVGPVDLKVVSETLYNGATRIDVVFVPVGVV